MAPVWARPVCADAVPEAGAALTENDCVVDDGAPNWSITLAVAEKLPGDPRVCTTAGVKNVEPSENCVLY